MCVCVCVSISFSSANRPELSQVRIPTPWDNILLWTWTPFHSHLISLSPPHLPEVDNIWWKAHPSCLGLALSAPPGRHVDAPRTFAANKGKAPTPQGKGSHLYASCFVGTQRISILFMRLVPPKKGPKVKLWPLGWRSRCCFQILPAFQKCHVSDQRMTKGTHEPTTHSLHSTFLKVSATWRSTVSPLLG